MSDYAQMTTEDLEAKHAALDAQRAGIKEQMVAITKELDARSTVEAAQKKLAAMSDSERAALAQIIKTEGVQSAEQVNGV